MNYTDAGVDTQLEQISFKPFMKHLSATLNFAAVGKVLTNIGGFANIMEMPGGLRLAMSADGVGTKVLIAQEANRYDTIGIDCIAMNVNDVICV